MSDDLFSQLFELFNQPGPVNMKLAAEVARHLAGEREPVEPWAAEEFRELTRLAEFRIEQHAPFPVHPAPDVLPVDGREWAERNLEGFAYLAEPFADLIDTEAAGPAAEMLKPLGPAMVGMQVGTLVGSLSKWVMASFDAGVPVRGAGPTTYVVPRIETFAASNGFERRDARLWAALNEAAHRAMFRVPFTTDHLVALLGRYGDTMRIAPDRLMDLMQGVDPTDIQAGIDPARLAGLFDNPESAAAQRELEAFLGLTAGYRRMLVDVAGGELLPRLADMDAARDTDRHLGTEAEGSPFAVTFVEADAIAAGRSFCEEVARRYGDEELGSIWTREGRFPTVTEIDDPVAWASRVLLDSFEI